MLLLSPASLLQRPSPLQPGWPKYLCSWSVGNDCRPFLEGSRELGARGVSLLQPSSDLDDKTHPSILLHFLEACRLARAAGRKCDRNESQDIMSLNTSSVTQSDCNSHHVIKFTFIYGNPNPSCPPDKSVRGCFSPRTKQLLGGLTLPHPGPELPDPETRPGRLP